MCDDGCLLYEMRDLNALKKPGMSVKMKVSTMLTKITRPVVHKRENARANPLQDKLDRHRHMCAFAKVRGNQGEDLGSRPKHLNPDKLQRPVGPSEVGLE